jgi:hypothetical protein
MPEWNDEPSLGEREYHEHVHVPFDDRAYCFLSAGGGAGADGDNHRVADDVAHLSRGDD